MMIDKVAIVLARELGLTARCGESIDKIGDLKTSDLEAAEMDIGHVNIVTVARAAIEALREPTPEIIDYLDDLMQFGSVNHTLEQRWAELIDIILTGKSYG